MLQRRRIWQLTTFLVSMIALASSVQAEDQRPVVDLERLFSQLECPFGPCGIGANFGGSITGVTAIGTLCRNITTGQRFVTPGLASSWDCEARGLRVGIGDLVATAAAGIADVIGGESVGGSVRGVIPTAVLCLNAVTGDQIIVPGLASSWDCEALGLPVQPGHVVATGAAGIILPLPGEN